MKKFNDDWPVMKASENEDNYPEEVILDVVSPQQDAIVDHVGREYDFVGGFLADDDFYQGLNMVTVIRRKSDGKEFGYFWWDDISKHGESFVESNGDEFGLEGYCEVEDDWDTFVSFYVWVPVERYSIPAYKEANNEQ